MILESYSCLNRNEMGHSEMKTGLWAPKHLWVESRLKSYSAANTVISLWKEDDREWHQKTFPVRPGP